MAWYETGVLIIYFIALTYLFLYSLGQLHLTLKYLKVRDKIEMKIPQLDKLPIVTIQLPVYNEKYVAERLIDSVCSLNYPKDKLEIQVLDDSTDVTSELIVNKINYYQNQGIDIQHVQRTKRTGFKAGALEAGLTIAKGEFIAIFDADFLPNPDFIERTVPYFTNDSIGMVQTRWGHINKNYSTLTKLQAFGLDAHFSIEQAGRNSVRSFINFNGTAGVWRKSCIQDAGGWSADTLTEDLDLSYRAQLKGWKFKYLESVESPAELPILMPAIKSQQYRWNKGAAETSRKNLGKVYSNKMPLITKIHATFHLLNSSVFLMLLVVAVLSLPLLLIKFNHPELINLFRIANIFLIGFFSIAFYFWISAKKSNYTNIDGGFLQTFIPFITLSMGLSLHNGMAVLEGFMGRKTPFIRTPKFNIAQDQKGAVKNTYLRTSLSPQTIIELLLGIYFIAGIGLGIYLEDYGLVLFHGLLAIGYLTVFYQTVRLNWHG